jgi:peptidoglycan/xylan/chitin deacetylase (PgdA/CDA1 family)
VTGGAVLSFDLDGAAGLACRPVAGGWAGRLSSRSEAEFGTGRGVGRVLGALEAAGVRGTFFVPGEVALAHRGLVAEIAAAGHEVAHHGHAHLPAHELDAAGQRDEIERGLEALGGVLGHAPAGYRSPAWELTAVTLELLGEHGFAYDSSLMGDDRPYRLVAAGRGLVELPVHWTLDDVPWLAYLPERPMRMTGPAGLLAAWRAEHRSARADGRLITYTMHPDLIGRGARIDVLRALIDDLQEHGTAIVTAATWTAG